MSATGTGRAAHASVAGTGLLLPVATLLKREAIRFLRQRSRVVGALGQPILFWVLLGSGFAGSFTPAGAPFGSTALGWFFPGIVVLVVLFTAIYSTISVIEDRQAGFLQAVLVAPVPSSSIALGKILGGTILASGQGAILLAAAPLAGLTLSVSGVALALLVLVGLGFALTGLGLALAWRMESTHGFHLVINLCLLPLWLLSGAFFPRAGVPGWLGLLMEINPLTYGVAALRLALSSSPLPPEAGLPGLPLCLAVTAFFALATAGTSILLMRSPGPAA